MGDSEPADPPLVFRLCFDSIGNSVASAPALRDHYLTHVLPQPHARATVPLLTHAATVTLLTPPARPHTTARTRVYLLPPTPPSLEPPRLVPLAPSAFRDPRLPALLALALGPCPILARLALPPPHTFLLHAPRGAGATSALAAIASHSRATFVHLPAAHLLRHATTHAALHRILLHYLDAAHAAQPAVVVLDDAPFLFTPDEHVYAASFVHAVRSLARRPLSRVALVVCAAPTIHHIHPQVVDACDVVVPLSIDPAGEWALQLASRKTAVPLETVRARLNASAVTTISATIRRAQHPLDPKSAELHQTTDIYGRWQSISRNLGGLSHALKVLKRMLLYPTTKAAALQRFHATPARGLLLYGPPGTGKTHLVREAAAATNHPVLPVDAAGLARGEVGASEKLLADVFTRAESVAPCILFLDEIDALFSSPALSRLVAVLALRMDTSKRVVVIGATNKPWMVSKALLRPGRFEHVVKIPLPTPAERSDIARVYASKMEIHPEQETLLCEMATAADGFSGADIAGACRRAAMFALSRETDIIEQDLRDAFAALKPSVPPEDARQIENWSL